MHIVSALLAVAVGFSQPFDGKRTVVIEGEDGTRVRNLVSGVPAKTGEKVEWDGLDDAGKVVKPGRYRWRALAHKGLEAKHLMTFCNGYGSNHGTLVASATDGKYVFFATPVSEGGHEVVALNPDGSLYGAWKAPHGHGLASVRLAAGGGFVYAEYSGRSWGKDGKDNGRQILKIDLAKRQIAEFDKEAKCLPPELKFNDNTYTDPKTGKKYVAEAKENVVRIYDRGGKLLKTLGATPGGSVPGPYVPERLENPSSVVVGPNGLVWVTESWRWDPKRLVAFDETSGKVVKSYFGPAAYGAPGAGIDPADATRWIGLGTLFKLDFEAKSATPTHVLGGKTGRRNVFHREKGRTYVITWDKATFIQLMRPDGSLRPCAAVSSAHQFAYYCGWKPPEGFKKAFESATKGDKRKYGPAEKPNHGLGFVWSDRNGNGEMDEAEFEFALGWDRFAGASWGAGVENLEIRVPAVKNGANHIVAIKPKGIRPDGTPDYPPLSTALASAVRTTGPNVYMTVESAVDRFGNVFLNSNPMTSFAPDGRCRWTYPNRWSGVHGSHDAPFPKCGELQGVLFFTGRADLDSEHDVFALTGNHGRMFFIDSSGLYVDELFSDVRTTSGRGVYMMGGEAFGGTFTRADDGTYYLQCGGLEYRVFRVDGFDSVVRKSGTLTVTAKDAAAAEAAAAARSVDPGVVRELRVSSGGLDAAVPVKWTPDKAHAVEARLAADAKRLSFRFKVTDDSPWVNNGTDVQALFKTGDACQIELESPQGPVRLLVAPKGAETVAVRYREKVKGGPQRDSVLFQSPWRSVRFDSVTVLASVKAEVSKSADGYVLEGSVPLADLGFAARVPREVRGDLGVIYGDRDGTVNMFRNHWSNKATGLVNDVPGEVMFSPKQWGTFLFGAGGAAGAGGAKAVFSGVLGFNPPSKDLKSKFPDADLKKRIQGWSPVWNAGGQRWGWGYHGTIYRYSADGKQDVALGGNSGSFIGFLEENPDCVEIKGFVAGRKPGEYYCRGANGLISRLEWSDELNRLVIRERIGDVSGVHALGMDDHGRVSIGNGVWEWNDAPSAPLRRGTPGSVDGSFTTVDGSQVLAFSTMWGKRGFFIGTLASELACNRGKEGIEKWMSGGIAGSAPLLAGGKRQIVVVGKGGQAMLATVNDRWIEKFVDAGLEWKTAPKRTTSVAIESPRDPKRLYVGTEGAAVVFDRTSDGRWRESARVPASGAAYVACDGTYLWVADSEANKVSAYRCGQFAKPAIVYAGSGESALSRPELIAAANGRVAVLDRGHARIVKISVRD